MWGGGGGEGEKVGDWEWGVGEESRRIAMSGLFHVLLPICTAALEKYLFRSFAHFKMGFFFFFFVVELFESFMYSGC